MNDEGKIIEPHIHMLARTTDAQGVTRLLRLGPDGPSQLAALNDHLAQVEPARIAPVRHAGPDGAPLTSWLYLPASGAPRGLVVIPYRGAVYPAPPALYAPGAVNTYRNAQILVGAGYAVLAPSLPYDAARTAWLEGQGFRVRRFTTRQVTDDRDAVLTAIKADMLSPPTQPFPHQGGRALWRARDQWVRDDEN